MPIWRCKVILHVSPQNDSPDPRIPRKHIQSAMSIPTQALPVMPTDPLRMTDVLIKDIYRQLAHDYPERVFAKILHENGDSSTIENVTWGRLMMDVHQAIHSMVQLGMDTPTPSVVGILGTSGYWYYVNLVACWMQDWPVSLSKVVVTPQPLYLEQHRSCCFLPVTVWLPRRAF